MRRALLTTKTVGKRWESEDSQKEHFASFSVSAYKCSDARQAAECPDTVALDFPRHFGCGSR